MTSDQAAPVNGVDLRRYWERLLSRWWLIFLTTVLGALIAAGYLYVVPPTYTASTTLSVYPLTTDRYAPNRNIGNLLDMGAEAVTASSFRVAEAAVPAVEGWTAAELRQSTTVSTGGDSATLTIRVSADREDRARAGATAVADAYLKTRSEEADAGIQSTVARDRERLDSYRTQLSEALGALEVAEPGSREAAQANADQQVLSLQVSALSSRISALEGIDTTGGVVLNPASATRIQEDPSTTMMLATGGGLGLLAGVLLAFLVPAPRGAVRSARDVHREFEIDTLGALGDEPRDLASLAQRIIRRASVWNARVVAVVFDEAVVSAALADQVAAEMRDAGTDAVSTSVTQLPDHQEREYALVPVPPDATPAERLRALRVSDVAVLVMRARATKVRSGGALMQMADEMGTPVVGALLLTGRSWRRSGAADSDEPTRGPSR